MVLLQHLVSLTVVNIGSGNGLVPDGTKPFPEPLIISEVLCNSPEDNTTGNAHESNHHNSF